MAQTWLYEHGGSNAVAYTDDGTWYYTPRGQVYGWRSGTWLYAQPGNAKIGFFTDNGYLYDPDSRPIAWSSPAPSS